VTLSIVHSKLRSITPAAIKVLVILWSFVVLTYMYDKREREREKKRRPRINVIEMPVRPTLGIIPSGHNNGGA
jgi:hypothetical protein